MRFGYPASRLVADANLFFNLTDTLFSPPIPLSGCNLCEGSRAPQLDMRRSSYSSFRDDDDELSPAAAEAWAEVRVVPTCHTKG